MKVKLLSLLIVMLCIGTASAQRTIYVSPTGNDAGDGSKENPWLSIQKALDEVEPGGTIYLREGTFYPERRLCPPRKATDEDLRITLASFPGERAVIDGCRMKPASVNEFKQSRCLYLTYWCNYYYVKDIDFTGALDNGVKVEGSYNIFENCRFHHNNDTGLQIGMFKDWAIEEHNGFYDDNGNKINGSPEFNPGYQLCCGNKVINCDSWANADLKAFGGSDDGGDADGFACKLFPGPGTEFYGCRAWINSDDNWDLYMVYHPIVIDNCWAYKGGYTESGSLIGNGNGFKLGGGGSSGGAAFSQSIGAHVVRNCVAFDNGHKGFDQNNAYEGMYIINCTGWGNEYNFRFPTIFQYGGMFIRNCVGFNPTKLNHEFLSESKEGSVVPDTDFNSWTTLDGCNPYKEGQKVDGAKPMTKDYSSEFLSLSVADFMADRQPDGSLPDNNFARLKANSVLIDKGTPIENFTPERFITQAQAGDLELTVVENFTIPYEGEAPDFGAFEFGAPKTSRLTLKSGSLEQTVYVGTEITPIIVVWSGDITDVAVDGLTEECGLTLDKNLTAHSATLSGKLKEDVVITFSAVGVDGVDDIVADLMVSDIAPATLVCTSGNASQTVMEGNEIEPITFEMGGGADMLDYDESEVSGLDYTIEGNVLTITGKPECTVTYTVSALGGMTDLFASGTITVVPQTHTLGAADASGWYQFQTGLYDLPEDLEGHVDLNYDNADEYGRVFSETGDKAKTFWDSSWTETAYSAILSSKGACNIGSGSALEWSLPSCAALKVNVFSTGSRSFKVYYKREGIDADWVTVDVGSRSKGAFTADLLAMANIEPCTTPIDFRFECSSKSSKMLGVRVFDMYVECFGKKESSSIDAIEVADGISIFATRAAVVAQGADISEIAVYTVDGQLAARSVMSGICPTASLSSGLYIVSVTARDGQTFSRKLVIK